jgi:hypothetical protein
MHSLFLPRILSILSQKSYKSNMFMLGTYETCRSTVTPGTPALCVSRARVDIESTSVAVRPPCRVPILFWCSGATTSSARQHPWPPLTIVTCNTHPAKHNSSNYGLTTTACLQSCNVLLPKNKLLLLLLHNRYEIGSGNWKVHNSTGVNPVFCPQYVRMNFMIGTNLRLCEYLYRALWST